MSVNVHRPEDFDMYQYIGSNTSFGHGIRWLREHPILTLIGYIFLLGVILSSIWMSPLSHSIKQQAVLAVLLSNCVLLLPVGHEWIRQRVAVAQMQQAPPDGSYAAVMAQFNELKSKFPINEQVIRTREPFNPSTPLSMILQFFGKRENFTQAVTLGYYYDPTQLPEGITLAYRDSVDGYAIPYLLIKVRSKLSDGPRTMAIIPHLESEGGEDPFRIIVAAEGMKITCNTKPDQVVSTEAFIQQVIDGSHPRFELFGNL